MSFQLKDFVSITAAMINRAKATQDRVTDFNIGSVARTLIEAPAIEIEELYQRMFAGIMDAIPVSIYRGFNFTTVEASKARGEVTISFGSPLDVAFTVPAGSVFVNQVTSLRYLSVASVTADSGATEMTVLVDAEKAGSVYNVGVGGITSASAISLPTGASISNSAITSGSDGETDAERAARFTAFIQSISRSTAFSVEYAASTAVVLDSEDVIVESVTRVDSTETPGYVQVFIYGAGSVASAELIAAAQRQIDGYFDAGLNRFVPGYRPIGVDVVVMPMTVQSINMTMTVTPSAGYDLADLESDIETATATAIDNVHAGETLYVDSIRNAALSVVGVEKVLVNISENSVCPANTVYAVGAITFVDGSV